MVGRSHHCLPTRRTTLWKANLARSSPSAAFPTRCHHSVQWTCCSYRTPLCRASPGMRRAVSFALRTNFFVRSRVEGSVLVPPGPFHRRIAQAQVLFSVPPSTCCCAILPLSRHGLTRTPPSKEAQHLVFTCSFVPLTVPDQIRNRSEGPQTQRCSLIEYNPTKSESEHA